MGVAMRAFFLFLAFRLQGHRRPCDTAALLPADCATRRRRGVAGRTTHWLEFRVAASKTSLAFRSGLPRVSLCHANQGNVPSHLLGRGILVELAWRVQGQRRERQLSTLLLHLTPRARCARRSLRGPSLQKSASGGVKALDLWYSRAMRGPRNTNTNRHLQAWESRIIVRTPPRRALRQRDALLKVASMASATPSHCHIKTALPRSRSGLR